MTLTVAWSLTADGRLERRCLTASQGEDEEWGALVGLACSAIFVFFTVLLLGEAGWAGDRG